MRRLRLLVTLVTVLAVPAQGMAGLAYGRSCQEQMAALSHAVLAGDCCPGKADPGTACKDPGTGAPGKNAPCSACKAGFNCNSPQSYAPAASVVWIPAISRSTPFSASFTPVLSRSPDGLWRPPRSL
ncbi:MAG: hypothetical protein JSR67_14980 [Proteobacteria bacterium]|nr:hypothetical protein [Pseudomonadota bacterium]